MNTLFFLLPALLVGVIIYFFLRKGGEEREEGFEKGSGQEPEMRRMPMKEEEEL